MRPSIRHIAVVAALVATLSAPHAEARLAHVTETSTVARLADVVVRGALDLDAGTLRVTARIGANPDAPRVGDTIAVHNLARLPALVPTRRDVALDRDAPVAEPLRRADVVVCLTERDGRHHLTETQSPEWVRPEASILVFDADRGVLRFEPDLLNERLVLVATDVGADATLKSLALARSTVVPATDRPRMEPDAAARFYAVIEPHIDLNAGVVHASLARETADELTRTLEAHVRTTRGVAARRGVEALLVLGNETGSPQPRRDAVEAALTRLVDEVGAETIVPVLQDECRRTTTAANHRTAARLLRHVGGDARATGRELLLDGLRRCTDQETTNLYFGLVYLGFEADAKRALAERTAPTNTK